jgi:hypothetical protein
MRADLRYLFASVAATAAFTFFALAFPNISRLFTTPGAVACFILTVYFLWPEIRDFHKNRQKRVIALIGMIVCTFGFAGFAAVYFWPHLTEVAAETSPLDEIIQISCDPSQYPITVPQNKIFELQLNNHFMTDGGAFLSWTLPTGATMPVRDPSSTPSFGLRLRISNYGKVAIVNTTVTFRVEFMAVEKIENGTKSGDVQKSVALTTLPFSIGPSEFVDIYAMNYSVDAYVQVSIPATAQGFAVGSGKRDTFKLISPLHAGMGIPPFAPKSQPTSAPPTPSPPSKPGKT